MKKFANESKLNIHIAEQDGGFAKNFMTATLSFFISFSMLNLAFVSLGLQKAGFSAVVIALCLVLTAIFEIVMSYDSQEGNQSSKKTVLKLYGMLILIAALIIASVVFRDSFGEGLRALMQRGSVTMTESQGKIYNNFISGQASKGGICLLTLMAAIGTYELVLLSIRKGAFYTFMALFLVEIYLVHIGVFEISISFIVSIMLLTAGTLVTGSRTAIRISGGRAIISSITATVLILLLVLAPLVKFDVLPLKAVGKADDALKSALHRKIYGGTELLPGGNLAAIKDFEPSRRVQLEVTMSKAEPMYLRGFVGEYLEGNKWIGLKGMGLSEARDDFYWLRQSGTYGESLLAKTNRDLNGKDKTGDLRVKPVNADRRNLYLPYSFLQEKRGMYQDSRIGDSVITADGKSKSYTLKYSKDSVKEAYVNQKKMVSHMEAGAGKETDAAKTESVYRNFVYKNYLNISDRDRITLKKILGDGKKLSTGEAKLKILDFMNNNLKYDDGTRAASEDDELGYFLRESKTGKSELYASAATQMLRFYGIPARYVEGYVITDKMLADDTDSASSDSSKSNADESKPVNVSVTEENAHAWCEYYLDGVGWLPFDASPKYRGQIKFTKTDDAEKADMGGGKGSEADASDSSEKNEENKDTNENIENPANSQSLVFAYAKLLSIIVVLLVILAVVIVTAIRRHRLKRFLGRLKTDESRSSVKKGFSYSMYLISQKLRDFNVSFVRESEADIRTAFPESAELLIEVLAVNDRAVYASDSESISEDDRTVMLKFVEFVSKEYAKGRKMPYRVFDKFIRVIY